ncbi:hypothetical protein BKA58DRAFT_173730 [Alternaria rosae]|uniref:uncharacterized protein n=1 Tax=Alternaria rosae TaxID=1187941 RepID=UPI001E8EAC9F|nr:uncharacterized protein BKA58DRAFT_173730 [Alternaria rosae]KAH6870272.1 hypothetical protein BKA58DRAFT_173730 [Alternaria rosae]
MIRTSLRFCALSIGALVAGKNIPNPQVRATGVQVAIPESLITPAPKLHDDIFKRSIATCGFIRGNSALPVTCAENYNCITTQHLELGFACCNNVECLDDWTTCRPYGQTDCFGYALPEDTCTSIYGSILQCSQQAQQCFRYARSAALSATDTFYSWACGTASDDILVLATVTDGGAVQTVDSETTGIDDVLRSITGGGPQPTAGSNSPPVGGGSSSSSGKSNPISTTAIALITVAGIVVVVIALLIGYFCWWKRRPDNINIVQHNRPSQLPYEPTVTQGPRTEIIPSYGGSRDEIMASWSGLTPPGASPNVAPSEAPSDWSGPTASEMLRPMSTVHESGSSFGNRFYSH